MSRTDLTKVGIYVLLILVILKFVVLPLNGKIKEKREILSEITQTYSLKMGIYERRLFEAGKAKEAPELINFLYDKGHSYNVVKNVVLNWLMEQAEKRGLLILNFEIPEVKRGKNLSEINVTLRLKGEPKSLFEFLQTVEQTDRIILIRNLEMGRSGQDFSATIVFAFFRREI